MSNFQTPNGKRIQVVEKFAVALSAVDLKEKGSYNQPSADRPFNPTTPSQERIMA
jgi:hypothetical protein